MAKKITVLAGPNGAGKSSIINLLQTTGLINCHVVNIDALKINANYLPNDPLRFQTELNKTIDRKFKELCEDAIANEHNFSFECNLRTEQVKYLSLFESANYEINLIFVWLDNIQLSFDRVEKRVKEGGHFIGKESIEENFNTSLKNLDNYLDSWNSITIIDNSKDIDVSNKKDFGLPLLAYIEKGKTLYISQNRDLQELKKNIPHIVQSYIQTAMNK